MGLKRTRVLTGKREKNMREKKRVAWRVNCTEAGKTRGRRGGKLSAGSNHVGGTRGRRVNFTFLGGTGGRLAEEKNPCWKAHGAGHEGHGADKPVQLGGYEKIEETILKLGGQGGPSTDETDGTWNKVQDPARV